MSMVAFHSLFPEIAAREVRTALAHKIPGLPDTGAYLFQEAYCVEPGCECRRVLIGVIDRLTGQQVATISHAFDPDNNSHNMGRTFLDRLNPQSQYSQGLLDMFCSVLLDEEYANRLERHYCIVKEAVKDPAHRVHKLLGPSSRRLGPGGPIRREAPRVSRNAPCPCGSGRKYKRCCDIPAQGLREVP